MNTSNFEKRGSFQYDQYAQNNTHGKFGKGYTSNGSPKGVKKQKCNGYSLTEKIQTIHGLIPKKCDGTIIAVKITVNNKGFSSTSEEVCNKCGKVNQTLFQVINIKQSKYNTSAFTSHDDWLNQMKEAQAQEHELPFENYTVNEEYDNIDENTSGNTNQDVFPTAYSSTKYKKELAKELGLHSWKSEFWNRSNEETMKWKMRQYYNYIECCKNDLELHQNHVKEVKYLLSLHGIDYYDKRGKVPYEEVIICMCIYVKNKGNKQQKIARQIQEYERQKLLKKGLYSIVKQEIEA